MNDIIEKYLYTQEACTQDHSHRGSRPAIRLYHILNQIKFTVGDKSFEDFNNFIKTVFRLLIEAYYVSLWEHVLGQKFACRYSSCRSLKKIDEVRTAVAEADKLCRAKSDHRVYVSIGNEHCTAELKNWRKQPFRRSHYCKTGKGKLASCLLNATRACLSFSLVCNAMEANELTRSKILFFQFLNFFQR